MLKQFIIDMKLKKDNFLVQLFAAVFGFMVGFGILCAIMFLDGDAEKWFCLGTLVALFALVMCAVIFYGLAYRQELNLALSMGRTRRQFVCAYVLRQLVYLVAGYVLVLLLYRLELALGAKIFAAYRREIDFGFLTDWRYVLAAIPAITLVTLFIGTLYSYFGKKAGWILYALWMALGILGPRMISADPEDTSFLGQAGMGLMGALQAVPAGMWVVISVAAVAVMLTTIVQLNRKQMVH